MFLEFSHIHTDGEVELPSRHIGVGRQIVESPAVIKAKQSEHGKENA